MFKSLLRFKAKRSSAYKVGQELGGQMFDAVKQHMDGQLRAVSANLIAVFFQRLQTIHDEANHPPEIVAQVEWQIFQDNIDSFPVQMRTNANESLAKWLEIAESAGVLADLSVFIENEIAKAKEELVISARAMLAVTLRGLKQAQQGAQADRPEKAGPAA